MRSSALFALFGALALVLFVFYFDSATTIVASPPAPAQTLTTATSSDPAPTAIAPVTASTTATTTPKTIKKPVPTPVAQPEATPVVSAPAPAPAQQAPAGDITASGAIIRGALVNIICDAPDGLGIHSISGSGVIIDPRGIILTNAHIGQYFLLANQGVSCVIRTGSPATDAYDAAPIFVSPAWISANAADITEDAPTGTGEHDIALLAITASASSKPLPLSYSYAPLEQDAPVVGEPVVIGSYAAQFLQSSEIDSDLSPTIVYGAIQAVYTFAVNSVDIVSFGGSAAAQEGSSGGGAVDASGELTATITTSTTEGDTSTRELNALTASYIRRDYASETGATLDTLLADNPSTMIRDFAPQIPFLEAELTAHFTN